jgi:hypothetical protein
MENNEMIAVKVLVILGSLAILFCVAGWYLCDEDFNWYQGSVKFGFAVLLIIVAIFNIIVAVCII